MNHGVVSLCAVSDQNVVAEALEEFVPVIGDAESEAVAWVPVADVDGLPLHPGFAASWPALRAQLA